MSKIGAWIIELDSKKTEHELFLEDFFTQREPYGYDEPTNHEENVA